MTRDRIDVDAALDQLRNELSIAPPPHFENRARVRVSNVRRANRSLVRRTSVRRMSTHALAAVLVIAAASFGRGWWLASTAPHSTPAPAPWSSRSSVLGPGSLDPGIASGSVAKWSPRSPAPRAGSSKRVDTFEVVVPPDQARALAQLLAAARGDQVMLPERRVAVDPETGELMPPTPIEIAALPAIPPLDPIDEGVRRDP